MYSEYVIYINNKPMFTRPTFEEASELLEKIASVGETKRLVDQNAYSIKKREGGTILYADNNKDCISRSRVLSFIDSVANSGRGKAMSLEHIRKYVEKMESVAEESR